ETAEIHCGCSRCTDHEVHHRDRYEIGRDVLLHLLRNIHRLTLFLEIGQYLDDAAEKDIAGHQQEIQNQHGGEEAVENGARSGKQGSADAEITVNLNDGLAVAWRVGDFLGLLDHALQGIDG